MTPEQIAALAAGYGLDPDTATEADIMAAANAAAEARAADPPADPPVTPPDPTREPEPVTASGPESRTRTISAAQFDDMSTRLQSAEQRLAEREEAEQRAHRDGLIAAALQDGRIAPSERDSWRTDLDDAPEATERILARLEPNRIPVQARGVSRQDSDDEATADSGTGWFTFADQGA